ncbi:alpha/beta fold hydrolase [Lentzea sp. NPDC059081]|uniref:alpha/beta fold hydrolase n=1 Tax=Lentzea sp. NPDC059081 TaxID=3346719 RepID=UPI003679C8A4
MSATTAVTRTVDVGGTPFAYREIGVAQGVPLVFLHHFTAVVDDWDPAVVDGLAAQRRVVLVDLRGVGGSGGTTPDSVEEMAADVAAFVRAMGFERVDLLGLSLGGMVAQVVAQREPVLVRRVVLVGTSPAGDAGPANALALLHQALEWSAAEGKHPKHLLFFPQSPAGQDAADAFAARLGERVNDRVPAATNETVGAQAAALAKWEQGSPAGLAEVRQPVLVVNGDNDFMLPTLSSFTLAQRLPDARLSIYPGAGHAALFQHPELFVRQALEFLG